MSQRWVLLLALGVQPLALALAPQRVVAQSPASDACAVVGVQQLAQAETWDVRPPVGEMWLITRLVPHWETYGPWFGDAAARWYLTDGMTVAELVPWSTRFLQRDAYSYSVGIAGAAAAGNVVQTPVVITNDLWLQAANDTGRAQGFAYTGTRCGS